MYVCSSLQVLSSRYPRYSSMKMRVTDIHTWSGCWSGSITVFYVCRGVGLIYEVTGLVFMHCHRQNIVNTTVPSSASMYKHATSRIYPSQLCGITDLNTALQLRYNYGNSFAVYHYFLKFKSSNFEVFQKSENYFLNCIIKPKGFSIDYTSRISELFLLLTH